MTITKAWYILAFTKIDKKGGLHRFESLLQGTAEAGAIFVGGGNSFVLVDQLHQLQLIDASQKNSKWNSFI